MRVIGLVGLAIVAQGCVATPYSNSVLETRDSTLSFAGVTDQRVVVTVEVLNPRGTYVPLGTDRSVGGNWSVDVDVPEWAFFTPPCNFATFRVRDNLGRAYAGRDQECLDDPRNAGFICPAAVFFIQRPLTHSGSLTLAGQSQADAYKCVTTLDGDLSIAAGETAGAQPNTFAAGVAFSLPRLKAITGSLSVDGQGSELVNLPRLTHVDGDVSMTLNTRRFENGGGPFVNKVNAPMLASIGGNLQFQAAALGFQGTSPAMDLGLPALTSLGAGLTIHNPVPPNMHMVGLNALATVPGDLTFNWQSTDLFENGLLPALATVGGSADITLPANAHQLFPALTTITGNVNLHAAAAWFNVRPGVMPQLATVGGNFALENMTTTCSGAGNRFGSLQTVEGAFSITGANSEFERPLGGTGVNHLVLSSLQVTGTKTTLIPFGADLQVTGAGAVTFQDNTHLCPCQITLFAMGLTANGWMGAPPGGTNNGTQVSCAPCPAPQPCP